MRVSLASFQFYGRMGFISNDNTRCVVLPLAYSIRPRWDVPSLLSPPTTSVCVRCRALVCEERGNERYIYRERERDYLLKHKCSALPWHYGKLNNFIWNIWHRSLNTSKFGESGAQNCSTDVSLVDAARPQIRLAIGSPGLPTGFFQPEQVGSVFSQKFVALNSELPGSSGLAQISAGGMSLPSRTNGDETAEMRFSTSRWILGFVENEGHLVFNS